MSDTPVDVPLLEILDSVPLNGRAIWDTSSTSSRSIPYGNICYQSALRIRNLERELAEAEATLQMAERQLGNALVVGSGNLIDKIANVMRAGRDQDVELSKDRRDLVSCTCQLGEMKEKLAAVTRQRDQAVETSNREHEELIETKRKLEAIHSPASDVWVWQNDGHDHPESMVATLPVVMEAHTLQLLIKELTEARRELGKCAKHVSFGTNESLCAQLAAHKEALEKCEVAFMMDEPWPLMNAAIELSGAADILLHEKDYDGHGWELIQTAQAAIRKAIPLHTESLAAIAKCKEQTK